MNCGLHPLIHILLDFDLAQDVESIKSRAEAPQCFWEMDVFMLRIVKGSLIRFQSSSISNILFFI